MTDTVTGDPVTLTESDVGRKEAVIVMAMRAKRKTFVDHCGVHSTGDKGVQTCIHYVSLTHPLTHSKSSLGGPEPECADTDMVRCRAALGEDQMTILLSDFDDFLSRSPY
jgi:hypothetical protein